jgi:hypothetical protein
LPLPARLRISGQLRQRKRRLLPRPSSDRRIVRPGSRKGEARRTRPRRQGGCGLRASGAGGPLFLGGKTSHRISRVVRRHTTATPPPQRSLVAAPATAQNPCKCANYSRYCRKTAGEAPANADACPDPASAPMPRSSDKGLRSTALLELRQRGPEPAEALVLRGDVTQIVAGARLVPVALSALHVLAAEPGPAEG